MFERYSHFFFSTKVWLTSVIITPFFIILLNPMTKEWNNLNALGEDLLLMLFFGGFFSIPNWILLVIASWQMSKRGKNIREIKRNLTIISIVLTCTLFFLVIAVLEIPIMWWVTLFYAFTISVGIQFYHLKNISSKTPVIDDILDDGIF